MISGLEANWESFIDAVFFASKCGVARSSNVTAELMLDDEETDNRCRSVGAAVQFAKSNNLLGVMLNAKLLVSNVLPFVRLDT